MGFQTQWLRPSAAPPRRGHGTDVWATADIHGQQFTLFNTHLASDDVDTDGSVRAQRLREIISSTCDRPAYIAGDFNDHQPPNIVRILDGDQQQDAWTYAHSRSRNGLTNPTKNPYQRLDHILVPPTFAVEHVQVPDTNNDWAILSDHLPAIATINLA